MDHELQVQYEMGVLVKLHAEHVQMVEGTFIERFNMGTPVRDDPGALLRNLAGGGVIQPRTQQRARSVGPSASRSMTRSYSLDPSLGVID